MKRNSLIPILLVAAFVLPMQSQRQEEAVEVEVAYMRATPLGVRVTLRANQSGETIRLVVGTSEGEAIARAMSHQRMPRPMTHDLLKSVLDRNGWQVKKVVIRDLVDGTYLADLVLERDGETQVYDARPSDAMAIGLCYDAKIYVAQKVFELQRRNEGDPEQPDPDAETLTL